MQIQIQTQIQNHPNHPCVPLIIHTQVVHIQTVPLIINTLNTQTLNLSQLIKDTQHLQYASSRHTSMLCSYLYMWFCMSKICIWVGWVLMSEQVSGEQTQSQVGGLKHLLPLFIFSYVLAVIYLLVQYLRVFTPTSTWR